MRVCLFIYFICCCSFLFASSDSTEVQQLTDSILYGKNRDALHRISLLKEAWIVYKKNGVKEDLFYEYIVGPLSQNYSRIGDFDRAIEYNSMQLNYYLSTDNHELLAWTYNDRAVYYNNKREFNSANRIYQEGLSIALEHGIDEPLIDFYDGLASTFTAMNKYQEAKKYLDLEEAILRATSGIYLNELKLYFHFNKAEYLWSIGDVVRAKKNYKIAIDLAMESRHRKGSNAMIRLAELYMENDWDAEAVVVLNDVLIFNNITTNPNIKDPYLLSAYSYLGQLYASENKSTMALAMVKKAEELAMYFHNEYLFTNSKFFLDDIRRKNLELGVKVSCQLFEETKNIENLQQAIIYADNAKSNVLNERMQTARKLQGEGISKKMKNLHFQWTYQLNEYESNGDVNQAVGLRNSLDSLNNELGLKRRIKFGLDDFQVFQSSLSHDDLILDYFIVDSSLYIFSITQNKLNISKKKYNITSEIEGFYNMLQDPRSTISDYSKLGTHLYDYLLSDNLGQNIDKTNLIIVPDKALNYLVFDVLPVNVSQGNRWSRLPYLGNDYTVSYDFSLETLSHDYSTVDAENYIGFAPSFEQNKELYYLKNSSKTVQLGMQVLGGKVFLGSNATASSFISEGLQSNILQLYTHGVSSDSSYDASFLYFQDRKMFVDEIMALPIRTKLCLLTACEVGLGKSFDGEGVAGVAWAFRSAGAENVVQTLWKINQESSTVLMSLIYKSLKDGEVSNKALQIAKLGYLQNEELPERVKHPYYWAGMCHYGKGVVLDSKTTSSTVIFLWISVVVLILGGGALTKRYFMS